MMNDFDLLEQSNKNKYGIGVECTLNNVKGRFLNPNEEELFFALLNFALDNISNKLPSAEEVVE